ncbi:MAG: MIP/aquaporin family protein [Rubrobacteraceae bacterium]
MQAYLAEFIGTMILVLLGDGVVAGVLLRQSKAENAGWIVITFGWGMAVAIAVYSVGAISGAHINPAVTVGLASIGSFDWVMVPGYIIAQLLGAFTGAVLVFFAYLNHWAPTADPALKLGVFCTAPEIPNTVANFITEVIGTAMLVFGVVAIAANTQQIEQAADVNLSIVFSTGILPLIIGLLVFSIGLSLGGPTGYAINPARDLGPRIAHALLPIPGKGGSDWGYSWIPIVGPLVGGVIGAVLYTILGFGG